MNVYFWRLNEENIRVCFKCQNTQREKSNPKTPPDLRRERKKCQHFGINRG